MSSSNLDRTRVAAPRGIGNTLAAVSGAGLLLMAAALGLLALVEAVGRYGFRRTLYGFELSGELATYLGYGMAGISVLALPAALAAPFARVGDPPLRSRSALALVPGCLVALAATTIGIAATIVTVRDFEAALAFVSESAVAFGSYELLSFPLTVAVSAIIGGARTPEATAAVAAPTALAALIVIVGTVSLGAPIGGPFELVLLAAALIAGAATAVLYAVAPARAVTPWLLGWVLGFVFWLSIASGLFTQTETAGLLAILAIVIALPVRLLALRQPFAPMLRQLGTETVAITSCLAAALYASPFAKSGLPDAVAAAAGTGFPTIALVAAGYMVLAYLLTPFLTLALLPSFVFPLFQSAGLDSVYSGAVLLVLGAAAAIARAGRSRAEAPHLNLPPRAAWILAALLVGLAVVVVLVPPFR